MQKATSDVLEYCEFASEVPSKVFGELQALCAFTAALSHHLLVSIFKDSKLV